MMRSTRTAGILHVSYLLKRFDFPKHRHIPDSQYHLESGGRLGLSCFTNTSLLP